MASIASFLNSASLARIALLEQRLHEELARNLELSGTVTSLSLRIENETDHLRPQLQGLQARLDASEADSAARQAAAEEASRARDGALRSVAELTQRLQEQEARLQEGEHRQNALREDLLARDRRIEQLERELSSLSRALAEAQEALARLEEIDRERLAARETSELLALQLQDLRQALEDRARRDLEGSSDEPAGAAEDFSASAFLSRSSRSAETINRQRQGLLSSGA